MSLRVNTMASDDEGGEHARNRRRKSLTARPAGTGAGAPTPQTAAAVSPIAGRNAASGGTTSTTTRPSVSSSLGDAGGPPRRSVSVAHGLTVSTIAVADSGGAGGDGHGAVSVGDGVVVGSVVPGSFGAAPAAGNSAWQPRPVQATLLTTSRMPAAAPGQRFAVAVEAIHTVEDGGSGKTHVEFVLRVTDHGEDGTGTPRQFLTRHRYSVFKTRLYDALPMLKVWSSLHTSFPKRAMWALSDDGQRERATHLDAFLREISERCRELDKGDAAAPFTAALAAFLAMPPTVPVASDAMVRAGESVAEAEVRVGEGAALTAPAEGAEAGIVATNATSSSAETSEASQSGEGSDLEVETRNTGGATRGTPSPPGAGMSSNRAASVARASGAASAVSGSGGDSTSDDACNDRSSGDASGAASGDGALVGRTTVVQSVAADDSSSEGSASEGSVADAGRPAVPRSHVARDESAPAAPGASPTGASPTSPSHTVGAAEVAVVDEGPAAPLQPTGTLSVVLTATAVACGMFAVCHFRGTPQSQSLAVSGLVGMATLLLGLRAAERVGAALAALGVRRRSPALLALGLTLGIGPRGRPPRDQNDGPTITSTIESGSFGFSVLTGREKRSSSSRAARSAAAARMVDDLLRLCAEVERRDPAVPATDVDARRTFAAARLLPLLSELCIATRRGNRSEIADEREPGHERAGEQTVVLHQVPIRALSPLGLACLLRSPALRKSASPATLHASIRTVPPPVENELEKALRGAVEAAGREWKPAGMRYSTGGTLHMMPTPLALCLALGDRPSLLRTAVALGAKPDILVDSTDYVTGKNSSTCVQAQACTVREAALVVDAAAECGASGKLMDAIEDGLRARETGIVGHTA